ncbi:DUF5752 family protein [Desulfatitalea alkaliphila]|uniref:DUF5752 family protein n=1 Tax=Desulfatitalea alkaliphila TaxID=2929485 RepID=A0AA41QYZ5_9BACT|nr:DUF5752 family protein [Desulfatitalea alkaliphila]MCJ8498997.1 DUF5752 family protein [Desulfatitalea alkaliphila]
MNPFTVTDCSLIVMATGESARNLRELLDRIQRLDDYAIIYFHFWDGLLRPDFVDPEYQNDFASWAYHDLHDRRLAERLSVLNPGAFDTMEPLRERVIEIIEDRMDETGFDPRMDAENPFFFMRSQIILFDTRIALHQPVDLAQHMHQIPLGSIFYHFIDARRRTDSGRNDFTEWLWGWGDHYGPLAEEIATIDPYFKSLYELREQLADVVRTHEKRTFADG